MPEPGSHWLSPGKPPLTPPGSGPYSSCADQSPRKSHPSCTCRNKRFPARKAPGGHCKPPQKPSSAWARSLPLQGQRPESDHLHWHKSDGKDAFPPHPASRSKDNNCRQKQVHPRWSQSQADSVTDRLPHLQSPRPHPQSAGNRFCRLPGKVPGSGTFVEIYTPD